MKGHSKSRYTSFCQCPKSLWLKVYKPEETAELDESVIARFASGNEVGELAKKLFGEYVDVTIKRFDGSLDLQAMIDKTREEMEKGTENICEASFSLDIDGSWNYCAVDILHKDGHIEAYTSGGNETPNLPCIREAQAERKWSNNLKKYVKREL